ncbi:MAG: response regulator [Sediminispirochaetaceae bacterium]
MDKMNKYKILYIDDERINTLNFKVLFRDRYTVLTSHNASEALTVIQNERPSIIFSDHKMPGKSGAELFCELIEKNIPGGDVPKVIITGYVDNEEIIALLHKKIICDIVYKPINERQIHEIVNRQLNN